MSKSKKYCQESRDFVGGNPGYFGYLSPEAKRELQRIKEVELLQQCEPLRVGFYELLTRQ